RLFGHRVDQSHSGDHFAEDRVAGIGAAAGVERVVVLDVDEKLRIGRVGGRGAGHGHGAVAIAQAVVGFVDDVVVGWFMVVQLRIEGARQDDKVGNHAVDDQAVIKPVVDVAQEVFDRHRRVVGQELEDDGAAVGIESYMRILRLDLEGQRNQKKQGGDLFHGVHQSVGEPRILREDSGRVATTNQSTGDGPGGVGYPLRPDFQDNADSI